jgi:hypothetical protein
MNWTLRYAEELENEFKTSPFTVEDARRIGHYSPNVTNKLLSELVKEGRLARVGKGIYTADISHVSPKRGTLENALPPNARNIVRILSEGGLDFMVTGMSVLLPFVHLLPYRIVHAVYVVPGGGERAIELLNGAGIKSILNPRNADEVNLALSLVDGDLVVVRETKGLTGRVGHIASVERALVDLYFEATRDKTPMSLTEVGRILRNAAAHGGINATRMTKLSTWHHMDREMRGVLISDGLIPPSGKYLMNDNVKAVTSVSER